MKRLILPGILALVFIGGVAMAATDNPDSICHIGKHDKNVLFTKHHCPSPTPSSSVSPEPSVSPSSSPSPSVSPSVSPSPTASPDVKGEPAPKTPFKTLPDVGGSGKLHP